ncbi:MAG: non-hydrolyzing UDP-N-acetylglucosamine 2-epimerase [Bacteroidota bacterium]
MSQSKRVLFVYGTRPEAIKMAPVIRAFKDDGSFTVSIAVTAQHREMLDQVSRFFSIKPDHDLDVMKPGQSLFDVTANCMKGLEYILQEEQPDMVFVQGDTTTAFVGALAAFYHKIPVAHIEAGLRSGNKYSPFPEEMNRIMTGHLADLHFAPTQAASDNLRKENICDSVHIVGNTVIDALHWGQEILKGVSGDQVSKNLLQLPLNKRFVLITGHRRESFGKPFEQLCAAIAEVANRHSDVHFIYPVHLNPNVQEPVNRMLGGIGNIHLISPLEYPAFIWLMERCHIVLTDSGGMQEEAPALGKPVLVMRDTTERQEGIDAGTARLVGTSFEKITSSLEELLADDSAYKKMAQAVNPYGDGRSSGRILQIVRNRFS